jgi:hypothetical protein
MSSSSAASAIIKSEAPDIAPQVSSVAAKFDTAIDAIEQLNGISLEMVDPGDDGQRLDKLMESLSIAQACISSTMNSLKYKTVRDAILETTRDLGRNDRACEWVELTTEEQLDAHRYAAHFGPLKSHTAPILLSLDFTTLNQDLYRCSLTDDKRTSLMLVDESKVRSRVKLVWLYVQQACALEQPCFSVSSPNNEIEEIVEFECMCSTVLQIMRSLPLAAGETKTISESKTGRSISFSLNASQQEIEERTGEDDKQIPGKKMHQGSIIRDANEPRQRFVLTLTRQMQKRCRMTATYFSDHGYHVELTYGLCMGGDTPTDSGAWHASSIFKAFSRYDAELTAVMKT